jgi:loricrin
METFFVLFFITAVMVALGSVIAREGSRSRSRAHRPGGYYDAGSAAHTGSYGMSSTSGADSGGPGGGDCGPGGYSDSGFRGGSSGGWGGGDSGGGFSGGGDGGGSSC